MFEIRGHTVYFTNLSLLINNVGLTSSVGLLILSDVSSDKRRTINLGCYKAISLPVERVCDRTSSLYFFRRFSFGPVRFDRASDRGWRMIRNVY